MMQAQDDGVCTRAVAVKAVKRDRNLGVFQKYFDFLRSKLWGREEGELVIMLRSGT